MSGRSVINYFTVSHRRHTPTDRPDRHPAVDFTSVHPDTSLCTVTNSFSPPAPELCVSLHLGQDAVSCVQYDTAIFKSIFSRMQRYRNLEHRYHMETTIQVSLKVSKDTVILFLQVLNGNYRLKNAKIQISHHEHISYGDHNTGIVKSI